MRSITAVALCIWAAAAGYDCPGMPNTRFYGISGGNIVGYGWGTQPRVAQFPLPR